MKIKMMMVALAAASGLGAATLPAVANAEMLVAKIKPTLCLDIAESQGRLVLWNCHTGPNQNFYTRAYGQISYNGKCLEGSTKGGDVRWTGCASRPGQRWGMQDNRTLKNETGLCLDIRGGNATAGQPLTMWDCNGGGNQKWGYGSIVPASIVPSTTLGGGGRPEVGAIYNSGGRIISRDGAGLVGNDGASLIGNDGSTLIGNDGSTFIRVN